MLCFVVSSCVQKPLNLSCCVHIVHFDDYRCNVVIAKVNNHKIDSTTMIRLQSASIAAQRYTQPSIEVVMVYVESGFELSGSQQEPSPWEDM